MTARRLGLEDPSTGRDGPEAVTAAWPPEEERVLLEFARELIAARHAMRWVAWLGGVSIGLATLVFFVLSVVNQWRSMK